MGLQRFTSVESALAMLFGKGVKIAKRDRVSGGDINEAFGLTLTDGRRIFMKANRKENVSFFMAESPDWLRLRLPERLERLLFLVLERMKKEQGALFCLWNG